MRALALPEIQARWAGEIRARIDRALPKGPESMDVGLVLESAKNGQVLILEHEATIMAVEVLDGDEGKCCHIIAYEGDGGLQLLGAYTAVTDRLASELGCRWVTLTGRHGWLRTLRKLGWRESSTTMLKEVN